MMGHDTLQVLPSSVAEKRAASAPARSRYLPSVGFLWLLAAGAVLRLWGLNKPDWQYDEGVYTRVAQNLLQHGTLNEHIGYGVSWQPFLYQPPLYFLALCRWFALTGPGIDQARMSAFVSGTWTFVPAC